MRLRPNPATLRPIAIAFAAFSLTAATLAAPILDAGDKPAQAEILSAPTPFKLPEAGALDAAPAFDPPPPPSPALN